MIVSVVAKEGRGRDIFVSPWANSDEATKAIEDPGSIKRVDQGGWYRVLLRYLCVLGDLVVFGMRELARVNQNKL